MDFEESAPETRRREVSGGLRNIHIVQNVPGTDTFFFSSVSCPKGTLFSSPPFLGPDWVAKILANVSKEKGKNRRMLER